MPSKNEAARLAASFRVVGASFSNFNTTTGVVTQVASIGTAIGGQTLPDLVGSLNVSQGWGSFQLSGAVVQHNAFAVGVSDKTGYAIQGAVKINLPMLAAGDIFWLQAAYAEGAISYLGYGGAGAGTTWGAAPPLLRGSLEPGYAPLISSSRALNAAAGSGLLHR